MSTLFDYILNEQKTLVDRNKYLLLFLQEQTSAGNTELIKGILQKDPHNLYISFVS